MLAVYGYAKDMLAETKQKKLPVREEEVVKRLGIKLLPYSDAEKALRALGYWDYAQTVSGLSFAFEGKPVICYADRLSMTERRHVIMHECGHIRLGHIAHDGVWGKAEDPQMESRQEQEAEAFAVYALAPPDMLSRDRISAPAEIEERCRISEADAQAAALNLAKWPRHSSLNTIGRFAPAIAGLCLLAGLAGLARLSPDAPVSAIADPPKAPDSGHFVCVTPDGERYHLPDCYQITGSEIFSLSAADAEEKGYTPCKTCRPEQLDK